VSRSASEPVSASKHQDESGQPSRYGEARTGDEVTGMCSHSALRGERGQRASRERSRNLGGPPCWGFEPAAPLGIHNQCGLHARESEGVVVAGKRGNSRGAKGPCRQYAESATRGSAWRKPTTVQYSPGEDRGSSGRRSDAPSRQPTGESVGKAGCGKSACPV